MLRKILFRCFFATSAFVMLLVAAVVVCGALAMSPPAFYAQALATPVNQADVDAAMKELGQTMDSLELFIQAGELDADQMRAATKMMRDMNRAGKPLPDGFDRFERLTQMTGDTFEWVLTERLLNAWIAKEMKGGKDWQRPRVAVEDDKLRFGVTATTPAAEVVLSCDFKLAKVEGKDLVLELHAVRCGELPLPAATLLKQYMRTDPKLPPEIDLNVEGVRPVLTFTALQNDGVLRIDQLKIVDDEVHLTFSRTSDRQLAQR